MNNSNTHLPGGATVVSNPFGDQHSPQPHYDMYHGSGGGMYNQQAQYPQHQQSMTMGGGMYANIKDMPIGPAPCVHPCNVQT